jgi:flavin reductase (DIM6/NTAB) family NADH-FMN oxidoreductase RutF
LIHYNSGQLRRALGNFATGVTIITAQNAQGQKVGVTANSFNSVSLDPALILWSIAKNSASCAVFAQASHFAVHILSANQIALANQFAKPSQDKFAATPFSLGRGSAPLLDNCAAIFECQRHQMIEGGDHWILLGKVIDFQDLGRSPLLYHQGAYSSVMPHPTLHWQPSQAAQDPDGQTGALDRNVGYLMNRAFKRYLSAYLPKQLASGFRSSEARLLLVLAHARAIAKKDLPQEIAMPMDEVEQAAAMLASQQLLLDDGDCFQLSDLGQQTAAQLFGIADAHQAQQLAHYSQSEQDSFIRILRDLAGLA